jgi:hypothetical protein
MLALYNGIRGPLFSNLKRMHRSQQTVSAGLYGLGGHVGIGEDRLMVRRSSNPEI